MTLAPGPAAGAVGPALSDRERYLARSALGLQYDDQRRSYRNGFVLPIASEDFPVWVAMAARGLACGHIAAHPEMSCFRMTQAGAEAALKPGESLCPEDFPPVPVALTREASL